MSAISQNITSTGMPQETAKHLVAIERWPHWQEIGLVAAKEYGMSQEQYDLLLPEYQRFLLLAMQYYGMGMFSQQIDWIWHSHILSTRKYQEFVETFNEGQFIHHLPQIGPKAQNTCTVCKSCKGCSTPHCNKDGDHDEEKTILGVEAGTVEHFRAAYLHTFGVEPPAIWRLPQPATEPEGRVL
jgi:hypothetical protein